MDRLKSFPKFPTKQIHIRWVDVIKSDEAWSNYRFLEDADRIFWGFGTLEKEV